MYQHEFLYKSNLRGAPVERLSWHGVRARRIACAYRGASLSRKRNPLRPYSRPQGPRGVLGGGAFSYGRGTPVWDEISRGDEGTAALEVQHELLYIRTCRFTPQRVALHQRKLLYTRKSSLTPERVALHQLHTRTSSFTQLIQPSRLGRGRLLRTAMHYM